MKIEKISENQIRCTLSKEDLIDRQLRLSELAYGTEKAKSLFRDMMQQAACEFGFEADDIPLMIEAIPISSECLVLVVTKVEDPDELDTRFSKFSPVNDNNEDNDNDDTSYADEILNCFSQLDSLLEENTEQDDTDKSSDTTDFIPLPESLHSNTDKTTTKEESTHKANTKPLIKVFTFHKLDDIIALSNLLVDSYNGINTLYKDDKSKQYYLVIQKSDHTPEEFNKCCNIITEYGKAQRTSYAAPSYYEEHFNVIIRDHALQILSQI